MGVVRDVTIDQLTQAVQGISSAGMTDTTGQDIKDSIDALDMTAETLAKDSSLQDIKDSIDTLANAISPAAANVTFDNTSTDLASSNAESAIKEVNNKVGSGAFKISEHYTSTTSAYGSINISALMGKNTSNMSIFNIFALNSNYANGIVSTLTVVGTNYFATFRDASNNNLVSNTSLDLYINYYEV